MFAIMAAFCFVGLLYSSITAFATGWMFPVLFGFMFVICGTSAEYFLNKSVKEHTESHHH